MSSVLPSWHYAAQWQTDQRFTSSEMTELGRAFHRESDKSEKERLLLELLRRFHAYLMKYVMMISRGRLPENTSRPDSDTHQFLRIYLKPGEAPTVANLGKVVRRLHLAFKGMPPEEIYDTLAGLMTEAITRWDPDYSEKIRKVIECIPSLEKENGGLIRANDVTEAVGFDAVRYCQRLAGYRYLEPAGRRMPRTWKLGPAWPPKREFLESGTIGLTYVVSRWFRWLLQRFITRRMSQLEHAYDVLQLGVKRSDGTAFVEEAIPSLNGDWASAKKSRRWAADVTLLNQSMDLGQMSLEWVESCTDPLFRSLSRMERFILYTMYSLGFTWSDIAESTGMRAEELKAAYQEILEKVRNQAGSGRGE